MDVASVLAGALRDEAMRYLYLLSQRGSPRALMVALLAAGGGAVLAGLVGRVQRRWSARQGVAAARASGRLARA
jgi:hypothetical protein